MAQNLSLPPQNTKRWVISRKIAVVNAVEAGLIARGEACKRYGLTDEEFQSWQDHARLYGAKGLRTTQLQHYRGQANRHAKS